jgi:hypothetical protein
MKDLALTWWKAFSIVTLTALNVTQVSGGHYCAAFVTGGTLSWVWWGNTRTANQQDGSLHRIAYAAGAACGTLVGMALGGLWK